MIPLHTTSDSPTRINAYPYRALTYACFLETPDNKPRLKPNIMKTSNLIPLCLLAVTVIVTRSDAQTRTEKDLLGEKQIPADAYYGVQTARALENFQVSSMKTNFFPDYVRAY